MNYYQWRTHRWRSGMAAARHGSAVRGNHLGVAYLLAAGGISA